MGLLIVGPPGAGKGTQATELAAVLNIAHVSTGELFRSALAAATPLGTRAKRYMDAGELVPDEITVAMLRERLADSDAARGFILDGFPRTVGQAETLDDLLAVRGLTLDAVLELVVPDDVLVQRMLARGRSDDTEDVVRRRLEVYTQATAPILDHYRDRVVAIDGEGDVAKVRKRILDGLPPRVLAGGRPTDGR